MWFDRTFCYKPLHPLRLLKKIWFDRIFCSNPIHPLRLIKEMWFDRTFCYKTHPSFEANEKDVV